METVGLYDAAGRPCGSAPRSEVRARNLRHAATVVVVRDRWGRVYVHRRTDTKDVYPGLHDFACGGVVAAGEEPDQAAVRELAEELGVVGVALEPLGEADYADEVTDYRAFRYVTSWDGPVRWQPEEVAWGDWMTLERLADALADPRWGWVPDSRALLGEWLEDRLAAVVTPPQGWDVVATVVEGRWVDRTPRRPDVAAQLLREAIVLPRLAPRLPLDVPAPTVLDDEPLRLRHVLVPGTPADPARLSAADGAAVGAFLRVLHDTAPEIYDDAGLADPEEVAASVLAFLAVCRDRVLPYVPGGRSEAAARLLDDVEAMAVPHDTLAHGDLGPDHLLSDTTGVTGVIDWGDLRLGDPALDLAWTMHGTSPDFSSALAATYGVTAELRARGLLWHRLAPWHEVLYGVSGGPRAYLDSGMAGIVGRLGSGD